MQGKRNWKLIIRRNWRLYCLLLIPLVQVFIFCYIPMGGIVIAFKDFKIRQGIWGSDWVGFDHFIKFFTYRDFWKLVKNTLVLSLYGIFASVPIPIIFALIVNSMRNSKFAKTVQVITTLPHFISVVVLVGIVLQIMDSRTGLYGMTMFGLTGEYPSPIIGEPGAFRHLYVWSGVWQGFGWGSIIYIAALTGVSPELHEAARIDGASRFQRVLYVDIPAIMPTIVTMMILNMGSVLSVGFQKILLMQNNMNMAVSEVISTYEYNISLNASRPDLSFATAIGLFNSVVNIVVLIIANAVARKVNETSLW